MSTLGTKIKKLREFRNYPQEYLAEKIGMSQSGYSRIEMDEVEVSHQRLEQIAKALDVSVQDILNFDEKQIINIFSNQFPNGNAGNFDHPIYNYYMSEQERKLYDDKVRLLEEMVTMLKEEVERLKKGK